MADLERDSMRNFVVQREPLGKSVEKLEAAVVKAVIEGGQTGRLNLVGSQRLISLRHMMAELLYRLQAES
jgi:hypothetical protein